MLNTQTVVANYFDIIFNKNPDVIFLISLDRTIVSVNNTVSKFINQPPEYCIGKSFEEFFADKKSIRHFFKGFDACCKALETVSIEMEATSGKLAGFSLQIELIPIFEESDTSNGVVSILAIFHDNTEMKRLLAAQEEKIEEQKVLSQRIISKANKLQNFSYIVSHNLRSPIASLVGLMDLYERTESDLEKTKIMEMVKRSVERLDETVTDLSEIIKINQNVDIKLEEIEFAETLEQVEDSIAHRLNETGAVIHRDFRACKRFIYNKAYIESILLNLITNAVKYRHPDRPPKIEILTWKNGSDVILSCRDNGKGIDLEKHGDKIFGLHKTFHGNQDARGVGLFITKNQIEALGGDITVDSEVGKWTRFKIRFSQKHE